MNNIAIDTNILIYSHFKENEIKREISHELLLNNPVVSTQVVSEYLNVMRRLLSISKPDLLNFCSQWMDYCTIQTVDRNTIQTAQRLVQRYDFQLFDSVIVASALEAGCRIFYSEDMQHGFAIEKQLKIINPFL